MTAGGGWIFDPSRIGRPQPCLSHWASNGGRPFPRGRPPFFGSLLVLSLGRIDPPGTPGVTTQDAQDTSPRASQNTVLTNRLHEVLTAGGLKSATRAQQGADRILIKADQSDDGSLHRGGSGLLKPRQAFHCCELPLPSRRTARRVNDSNDLASNDHSGAARSGPRDARGKTTKSNGAGSCGWSRRKASRNSLFHRFRTTALPTFRETTSPIRETGEAPSQA